MLLSDALSKYYVLPMHQSEIVSFDIHQNMKISVTWNDSETFDNHWMEFDDQEIEAAGFVDGLFLVRTITGEAVGFIALDGVRLNDVET